MNIIIPMAGWGSRLRPHSLTVPKPMMPVAGDPIVAGLCKSLIQLAGKADCLHFVIREDFGKEVEDKLQQIARDLDAECRIDYQTEPLGTAHAILCASSSLEGEVIIGFADTLFEATFDLDPTADATIWVKQVDDPRAFGVVNLNASNRIESFEEKPQNPKSDLAIIGVYHFKDATDIRREMQYLIDHDIRSKGEYQLTDALEQLRQKGTVFVPGVVNQWMDCGNKAITVKSNAQMLDIKAAQGTLVMQGSVTNSVLIEPVYIEEGCVIENSVVGPHVTLGKNTVINNSLVANSLVQHDTEIINASIEGSMIGSKCSVHGKVADLSIGDYTTIQL